MKAMLYTEIRADDLERLIEDPFIVAEQKMDGARVLVRRGEDGRLAFTQRGGEPVKFHAAKQHLPALAEVLEFLPHGYTLDGELIIATGHYHVFDCLSAFRPTAPYATRRMQLDVLRLDGAGGLVHVVPMAKGPAAKAALVARCQAAGVEGVMFKDIRQPYEPGARVRHSVKAKFTRTADVVVASFTRGRNEAGRETGSAQLAVYRDGADSLVPVGATSLIGKPEVTAGDVIEVEYLYWTGSSVYQPRMIRTRPDKAPYECTMAQFRVYSREVV